MNRIEMNTSALSTLSVVGLVVLLACAGCDDKASGGSGGAGGKESTAEGGAGRGSEGASFPSAGVSSLGGEGQGGDPGTGGSSAGTAGAVGGDGAGGVGTCGNSAIEAGEECDDGNERSGDGCSSTCVSKCEVCQRDTCPVDSTFKGIAAEAYVKAFDMPGEAEDGAAVNMPRATLVRDLLDCVYESKCLLVTAAPGAPQYAWNVSLRDCACANPPMTTSPDEYPMACTDDATRLDGPCLQQMMDAAEVESFLPMTTKIKNANLAIGRVYNLLSYCDAKVCAEKCVPEEAHDLLSVAGGAAP
jgi:cysteine-rich repeat protein